MESDEVRRRRRLCNARPDAEPLQQAPSSKSIQSNLRLNNVHHACPTMEFAGKWGIQIWGQFPSVSMRKGERVRGMEMLMRNSPPRRRHFSCMFQMHLCGSGLRYSTPISTYLRGRGGRNPGYVFSYRKVLKAFFFRG